jgi:hypothetical protein
MCTVTEFSWENFFNICTVCNFTRNTDLDFQQDAWSSVEVVRSYVVFRQVWLRFMRSMLQLARGNVIYLEKFIANASSSAQTSSMPCSYGCSTLLWVLTGYNIFLIFFCNFAYRVCLEWCMLLCVMRVIMCDMISYFIVLYCTVLYCHTLHCSTLLPGINTFQLIIIIIIIIIPCAF